MLDLPSQIDPKVLENTARGLYMFLISLSVWHSARPMKIKVTL